MRVGILTFHRALNYGAALQTYSLYSYLSRLCDKVEVIDYVCPYLEHRTYQKPDSLSRRAEFYIKEQVKSLYFRSKRAAFQEFINQNVVLSSRCDKDSIKSVTKQLDCLVVGSDQVWNPYLTDFDESYFLAFCSQEQKRIAYAASIGSNNLSIEHIERIKRLIGSYTSIGLREDDAVETIRSLGLSIPVKQVVDPTLLVEPAIFKGIQKRYANTSEKYILVYSLGSTSTLVRAAKAIADRRRLRLVVITSGLAHVKSAINEKQLSPVTFLGCIDGAECILTDSFHGVCLALQYGKPFKYYVSDENDRGSRLNSLARLLSFEDRRLSESTDDELLNTSCGVDALITHRNDSRDFLREALNNNVI